MSERGAPPYDPAMMVCLLLYAYCVGVFSSRKIALACERNLAFLVIVGQDRPDFRTISDFRKLHLEAFKDVFVQVVRLAAEAGLVKLGNVATDRTKIQGNASRQKPAPSGHANRHVKPGCTEPLTLILGQTPSFPKANLNIYSTARRKYVCGSLRHIAWKNNVFPRAKLAR